MTSQKQAHQKAGLLALNITVRDVAEDKETALPYAKQDSSSVVMYYGNPARERELTKLRRNLIDLVHDCGGTFYLAYQTGYTAEQLLRSYPEIPNVLAMKEKLDPHGLFKNQLLDSMRQAAN